MAKKNKTKKTEADTAVVEPETTKPTPEEEVKDAKLEKKKSKRKAREDESNAADVALKPIIRGKVVKRMVSKAAVEEAAEKEKEHAAVAEEEVVEREMDSRGMDTVLYRSVWMEVPDEVHLTESKVKRIFQTVGEVEQVILLTPTRAECRFTSVGPVRQALLLHNKPVAQLPYTAEELATRKRGEKREKPTPDPAGKATPRPKPAPGASQPLFSEAEGGCRAKVDLPLSAEQRVYVGNLPQRCENSEIHRALAAYGPVAYVYRNTFKSYGFAAFTKKKDAQRACRAEATMVRDKLLVIKPHKADDSRNWQTSRTAAAMQYLSSLVPLNPFVAQAPVEPAAGSTKSPARTSDVSPFSLAPMPPPSLSPSKTTPTATPAEASSQKKKQKTQPKASDAQPVVAVQPATSPAQPALSGKKRKNSADATAAAAAAGTAAEGKKEPKASKKAKKK
ncbi:hypothetical protein DIPPA_22867 [Diplonema papillatum]|nr:hypothetical protein DIPPA_22867 [Diplonema papillatum]